MQRALSPGTATLRALSKCSCALRGHLLPSPTSAPARSSRLASLDSFCRPGGGRVALYAPHLASRGPGLAVNMSTALASASSSSPGIMPQVGEIGVVEVHELLKSGGNAAEDLQLIDVREEGEHRTASLPGFQLLPLSRFQEWGPQATEMLDPEKETLVLCHHGVRSMRAALFLASQGFQDVKNISGGIDAYSRHADGSVPLY